MGFLGPQENSWGFQKTQERFRVSQEVSEVQVGHRGVLGYPRCVFGVLRHIPGGSSRFQGVPSGLGTLRWYLEVLVAFQGVSRGSIGFQEVSRAPHTFEALLKSP